MRRAATRVQPASRVLKISGCPGTSAGFVHAIRRHGGWRPAFEICAARVSYWRRRPARRRTSPTRRTPNIDGLVLETLAACSAISPSRSSGRSHVASPGAAARRVGSGVSDESLAGVATRRGASPAAVDATSIPAATGARSDRRGLARHGRDRRAITPGCAAQRRGTTASPLDGAHAARFRSARRRRPARTERVRIVWYGPGATQAA